MSTQSSTKFTKTKDELWIDFHFKWIKWIKGYPSWVERLWVFKNYKGIRLCGLKYGVYNYVFKGFNFKVLV
jgi:hypothetical protein